MPQLNLNLDVIQRARGALARQRDMQRDASVKLKQAKAALDDLLRSGASEQLVKREQARIQALQGEHCPQMAQFALCTSTIIADS